MKPRVWFRFCPRCGAPLLEGEAGGNFVECGACRFRYYFNPAISAVGFVERVDDGRVLLIQRSREPAKGKWGPPGGFIDEGERAEEALRRELREEVNVEIADVEFLCSEPNEYLYREVTYPVLDLFFSARVVNPGAVAALDDVEGWVWRAPGEVAREDLAFPSMRRAWEVWMRKRERR